MTDTEIVDQLCELAAEPLDCDAEWGDAAARAAAEAADGFWRGLLLALAARRTEARAL
jgi:hypothetical protein